MFDSISGVRLDHELFSASRKVEIDFINRLEVHRKRPRSWATDKGLHVIPTKWVDVNKGDEQRGCQATRVLVEILRKRTQTLGSDDAWNVCINGTARMRDVLFLQSADVETRGTLCDGSEDLVL